MTDLLIKKAYNQKTSQTNINFDICQGSGRSVKKFYSVTNEVDYRCKTIKLTWHFNLSAGVI